MLRLTTTGLALAVAATAAFSQELIYSPDISGTFSTVLLHDEDAATDNLAGSVTPVDLGLLPANAAVSALHRRPNGDRLFVLDISTNLNGLFVTPRDVVRYDGGSYTLEFDGAANGIPDGARIDALSEAKGRLLLSLDTSIGLSGVQIDDEDLVAFKNGNYQMIFDGSATGIDPALDLDGAHAMPNGDLLLSFDGSGHVGHLRFDDEDVLEYDPTSGNFNLVYDGSMFQPAWSAAGLDALSTPDPGNAAGSAGGGPGNDKGKGND